MAKTNNGNGKGNDQKAVTEQIEATSDAAEHLPENAPESTATAALMESTALTPMPQDAKPEEITSPYGFRKVDNVDEPIIVVNRPELETQVRAMRDDFVELETRGAALGTRLSLLLIPFALAKVRGYVEITNEGKEIAHPPAKPDQAELRDFCRKVLGMDQPLIDGPDEKSRINIKPAQANNLITLASKAAYLAAVKFDGITTAWFVGNKMVEPNTKGAVQRLAAPWNQIEPNIKLGKGDQPNTQSHLVPIGQQTINTSYAAYKEGKVRDQYGRLKGEPATPVTLTSMIKGVIDALRKAEPADLEANEKEIQELYQLLDTIVDNFAAAEAKRRESKREPLKRTG